MGDDEEEKPEDEFDPSVLAEFGTDLTALAEKGELPRAYGVQERCATLVGFIRREPWRSIALLGEAGVGKSALVNEVVHELAKAENGGWRVLRMSPTDFMSGTKYLGEWETKVTRMVEKLRRPRRVLIYVPNLSDLAAAGRWSKSDMNVATALAPYLEQGNLLLLGESTPQEFERGLGSIPSLHRLFDQVILPEPDLERTRAILGTMRDGLQLPLTDDLLDRLLDLASQYLGHLARPGNAAGLLKAVTALRAPDAPPVTLREILEALSQSTGLPVDLVDDTRPLQLDAVHDFFNERIIGQPEAVAAVVDLVTLIKAGLTDPNKPFGIQLFVGPTGVGKTELARALAEFIFGDADRLHRFDMSEYASNDGFERLIGAGRGHGTLTDAVRQQPFSVVLLDEIEKANLNVFDLCLQLFDAGRLTDGRGRTIDFRRTIIVLTSNVGAAAPPPAVGFAKGPPSESTIVDEGRDRVMRELARFFRPEFLNRIDRIVTFRALTLEVAERIARRELELILQRQGIARRKLALDVDPDVIALLVREGYSPHFGARPIKRTVERLCLLPVARAIATGRVAGPAVLALAAEERRVVVRISAEAKSASSDPRPAPADKLAVILDRLRSGLGTLDRRCDNVRARRSELVERTHAPGFYQDRAARSQTFEEIHQLEQFLAWRDRWVHAFEHAEHRLGQAGSRPADQAELRTRLEELARELDQLDQVARLSGPMLLGDALICLSRISTSGKPQRGVERLCDLYLALAKRRRMPAEVLAEAYDDNEDRAYLHVAALGAYPLFRRETGLHHFEHRFRTHAKRTGSEREQSESEMVRVEVLSLPDEPDAALVQETRAASRALRPARSRLVRDANLAVSLFHAKSLRSLDLWTRGPRNAALAVAHRILGALVGAPAADDRGEIIRRYQFGIGPLVRDLRSGRSTSRVERVFRGEVDFLHVEDHPAAGEPHGTA